MVNIEYFLLDSLTKTAKVKVTSEDSTLRKAVLYHNDEYRYKEGTDVLSFIITNEEAILPTTVIKDTRGFWLLEVEDSKGDTYRLTSYDYSHYEECILRKLLSIDIDKCAIKTDTCNTCNDNVLYSFAILETLKSAVSHNYYSEIPFLQKQLDELCKECGDTKDCNCKTVYGG